MEHVISTVRKVVYVALNYTTGVADAVVVVRKPDGSLLDPALVVAEQGEGLYTFEYTPDVAGVWQEKITSVINGDKAIRSVSVVLDAVGAVKTDTATIKAKTDNLPADTAQELTDIDTGVSGVDTKVTNVDTKVTGIASDITSVDGKVTSIETKIDDMDIVISPGGRFV